MDHNFFLGFIVFLVTLTLTVIIEAKLIPSLSERAKQPIYTEGPSWHLKKSGTPTMGGLAFLISILLSLLLSSFLLFGQNRTSEFYAILIALIYATGNSLIGIADDLTKLRRKENGGLTPLQKLVLQSLLAVLFLMARRNYLFDDTVIASSLGNFDLGVLYYPLSFLLLIGIVNCANLTDGIDGLASSVALSIALPLSFCICLIPREISLISFAIMGGCLGFLFFNTHPAKIFMGDTGSLFLGALIAALGFSLSNPLLALLFGGVYVMEGASVILQVLCFKLTGKRLFKMAPIHHHLEKCGMDETRICVIGTAITIILTSCAIMFIA